MSRRPEGGPDADEGWARAGQRGAQGEVLAASAASVDDLAR